MKLSAPIHILKSKAKELKKTQSITMTEALNLVAKQEGYSSWGLLQSKAEDILPKNTEDILGYLNPGDLILIGARPGQYKTSLTLEILMQAVEKGRKSYFFSLESSRKGVAQKLSTINEEMGEQHPLMKFNFSNEISSEYIIKQSKDEIIEGSLIAIDYLQLLDQKRDKPELQTQVESLKQFAKDKGCIIIFISQIDRSFEDDGKKQPSLDDVRLPNPLDLGVFNKAMFLHNDRIIFTKPKNFEMNQEQR